MSASDLLKLHLENNGKEIHIAKIHALLKREGLTWKRTRHSPHQRDDRCHHHKLHHRAAPLALHAGRSAWALAAQEACSDALHAQQEEPVQDLAVARWTGLGHVFYKQ